ncbi:LOW QUALITY PROTEIN: hypothetical protein HMPREF0018_02203, partial [Acinetobacter radioresistens SH164]
MWRLNACLRLKPFAVALKRLAAPRRVFNFAITTSLSTCSARLHHCNNDLQVRKATFY